MGPRTATEFASRQARAAWDKGNEAMAQDEAERARTWFARACRIAPTDLTPRFSLATACLAAGRPAEAADLFQDVARGTDAQAAWLGAASAHARLGQWSLAAAALHQALSHHAAGPGVAALADHLAAATGAVGWCGVDKAGRLILRAPRARVLIDGVVRPDLSDGDPAPDGAVMRVMAGRRDVLGSPMRLADIRMVEGIVAADEAGLSGWAWHPGDAGRDPVLTLRAGGMTRDIRASDASVIAPRPLARPRGFRIAAADLPGPGPVEVIGPDGSPLAGSPVDPATFCPSTADEIPAAATASAEKCADRALAVVIPAYRGAAETEACLRDVLATVPAGTVVFVVDDASPEPELVTVLTGLAASGRIRLSRLAANRGFPAAANAGLRQAAALAPSRDVVLLNSDTRMAPGWLHRLREAVQESGDIGTATPFSNDASIASYPDPAGSAPPARLAALSRLAARANPEVTVDIPTGVGFCLYLRHECLIGTGWLREDVFAQGYGEENDFCRRASRQGWRHVVVPGAYVAHVGGRSFGAARQALLARNLLVLERLHPGYRELVADWIDRDPLAPARQRLDLLRWTTEARAAPAGSVILVTHDDGGGVERCVRDRAAALRADGTRPILLRPVLDRSERPGRAARRTLPGRVHIEDPADPACFPNLVFRLPHEADALAAALLPTRPSLMEVHHLLGHERSVLDLAVALGIPVEFRLHDYAAFCPRITLTGAADRYCGEPDLAGCEACVAVSGSLLDDGIGPADLRARSAAEFSRARSIVVPSSDMAARMRRHFPGVGFTVTPHEAEPVAPLAASPADDEARIVVVGAIGPVKGHDILLACASDAANRRLALRFIVVGHTADDDALFDTGRVDITGPYREGEAAGLIAAQRARAGFVPSVWPETWCFALGEILAAGLPALAFDLGAQAERIRRTGRGLVLPLGAPPAFINNALLSFCAIRSQPPLAVGLPVMHTI